MFENLILNIIQMNSAITLGSQSQQPTALNLVQNIDFFNHLNETLLNVFNFIAWNESMGSPEYLARLNPCQIDLIIVDQHFDYQLENIASWLFPIKINGYLVLEAKEEVNLSDFIAPLKELIEIIPNDNPKVWQLKKTEKAIQTMDYLQAFYEAKDNNLVQALHFARLAHFTNPKDIWLAVTTQGFILCKLGLQELADKAVAQTIRCADSEINYFFVLYLLLTHHYHQGFLLRKELYDAGLIIANDARSKLMPPENLKKKYWNGQSLKNKRIVIWTEFGLGDEIMFSQLAHYLKSCGAKKVYLIAQKPVAKIIATHPDIDQVFPHTITIEDLPAFDYWVYPHEILAYEEKPFESLPKRLPYLFPKEEDIASYHHLFKPTQNLKIGIVWRGSPNHENDVNRSIHDLETIKEFLSIEGIDWYCFIKDCNEEEQAMLKDLNIPQITKDFNDLYESACALKHMDYFISVDTSMLHLAGSIGIKSFALLPYIVDWRWGIYEKDNVWYKNMVSFRNSRDRHPWDSTLKELTQTLEVLKTAHSFTKEYER